jgi:hypothetical protein
MVTYGHCIGYDFDGMGIAICKGYAGQKKKRGKAHTPPGVSPSSFT